MNELIFAIKQLLRTGTVKIEISISMDETKSVKSVPLTIECPHCGWSNTYSDQKSASAARRGHLAQCPEYAKSSRDSIPAWLKPKSDDLIEADES